MDQKARELKRNTLLIAISNIGSKVILFLLAPLYSYFLNTEQYGTMDLITTTVSLLGPIFCLDIYEATFRFASDGDTDNQKLYSSSIAVCFIGLIITVLGSVVSLFFEKNGIIAATLVFTLLTAFNSILTQFARGIGNMKVFVFSGILNAAILFVSNLLFLVVLKKELYGWATSYFLAKCGTAIFLCVRTRFDKRFRFSAVDKEYIKDLLRYCLPLLPTALMWWVMNVSDRYMLALFAGTAVTGIYAVSGKIPSILSLFENIFYQAWQTTAIKTLGKEEQNRFYSEVLHKYICIIVIGIAGLLLIMKPAIGIFAQSYQEAWIPAAILVISVGVHAVAGYLGAMYTVFKKTNGALKTAVVGAVTNIVLNLVAIPLFGMLGASITTLVGYLATLFVRWNDIKRYVILKLNWIKISPLFGLLVIQTAFYYVDQPWSYVIRFFVCAYLVWDNRSLLLSLVKRG